MLYIHNHGIRRHDICSLFNEIYRVVAEFIIFDSNRESMVHFGRNDERRKNQPKNIVSNGKASSESMG